MSGFAETVPPAAARNRSIEARRAAGLAKEGRERRIVGLLNGGVSVAEIAAREDVTQKRMRALISEILARRMPEPSAEFLALQVSRLNEALLVAYSAMSGGNLQAVDRVVKIVRELDRYHGFIAADRRSRNDEAKEGALALAAHRPEMAPQRPEKMESAPGNAAVPGASNPKDAALRRDPAVGSPLAPAQGPLALDAPLTDRLDLAPQQPEKAQSAPENGMATDSSDEAFASPLAPAQDPHASDAPLTDRLDMAPQEPEKAQSAPGSGVAPDSPDEAFPSRLAAPAQDPLALEALLMRRIEIAPQALERPESVPRNGIGAESARAPGGASFLSPAVGDLSGVKRPIIRATLNGVAACC